METDMNIVATMFQVLLGLVFLGAGASKLAGARMQVESFDRYRLPQPFRPIVGIIEIIGALGILASVAVPWLAALAALWLVGVMLGALMTHIRIRDSIQNFVPPAVLLCVAAITVVLRWSALAGSFS
jgi:uncharacterized membrane protein YphA (DoxX/SURF4 family)